MNANLKPTPTRVIAVLLACSVALAAAAAGQARQTGQDVQSPPGPTRAAMQPKPGPSHSGTTVRTTRIEPRHKSIGLTTEVFALDAFEG